MSNNETSGPSAAEFEALADEKGLSARRKEAEQKYRDFSTDQIDYIRRRCKTDLFFLCYGPLEYNLLSPRLHGHFTKWMWKTRYDNHRLILLPRGHFKSTVATIGESVQIALPNIAEVDAFPYCLGPNVKLLLSHEVRESASRFLYEITAAFMKKELMLALFPECIPTRREHRINKWELELPREQHHKEPTIDTIGAGGAAQGRHYNWIKLDDLIGEDARDSETVMGRVLTWFDNVNSLLGPDLTDGWDLIGTRWAYSDVYSHAMKMYGINLEHSVPRCIDGKELQKVEGGQLAVYARGAIENGEAIFPENYPLERLSVIRKNAIVWAAQYANNPRESGLNEFVWPLKTYNVDSQENLIVFSGDSSYKVRTRELDICILCDPSMGESKSADETGIVVTGTDWRNYVYILETVKKRLRPPEFIDLIFKLYFKYSPRIISIEEVNFSGIYRYWLEERMSTANINLPIRPYKPGTKRTKETRIRGLSHLFSAGQILIADGMHDLRDEYEQFPLGESQHLLDALAQGPEVWQPGLQQQNIQERQEVYEQIMDERSALTGY